MATIQRWEDGYILDMDPRREDPLFYYRREDDWSEVIGFEVLPLYEERTAERVEISVFADHRGREMELETSRREEVYVRVLPALIAHHESWKHVLLRGDDLEVVLESGSLLRELRRLGFDPEIREGSDGVLWSR